MAAIYDCPSDSEVNLKVMGKITLHQTTTKHDKIQPLQVHDSYRRKCTVKNAAIYRQTSNISRALAGNRIVDHSDVACRRCSNYIFILNLTAEFNRLHARKDKQHLSFGIWCDLY